MFRSDIWTLVLCLWTSKEDSWLSLGVGDTCVICSPLVPAGQWARGGDCLCVGRSDVHHWPQSDCGQIPSRRECQCLLCRWEADCKGSLHSIFPSKLLFTSRNPIILCLPAVGNNFPMCILQKAQLVFLWWHLGKVRVREGDVGVCIWWLGVFFFLEVSCPPHCFFNLQTSQPFLSGGKEPVEPAWVLVSVQSLLSGP